MRNKILFIIGIALATALLGAGWFLYKNNSFLVPLYSSSSTPTSPGSAASSSQEIAKPGIKTYRNTDFGFEFQYPEGWTFHANTFSSPASKFNLIGASPEEDNHPDPISPSLLVNVVTPDFAKRAFSDLVGMNIVVAGGGAKKYEYDFEDIPRVSIDLPFGEYHLLLGANRQHEAILNQLLITFKFIK